MSFTSTYSLNRHSHCYQTSRSVAEFEKRYWDTTEVECIIYVCRLWNLSSPWFVSWSSGQRPFYRFMFSKLYFLSDPLTQTHRNWAEKTTRFAKKKTKKNPNITFSWTGFYMAAISIYGYHNQGTTFFIVKIPNIISFLCKFIGRKFRRGSTKWGMDKNWIYTLNLNLNIDLKFPDTWAY